MLFGKSCVVWLSHFSRDNYRSYSRHNLSWRHAGRVVRADCTCISRARRQHSDPPVMLMAAVSNGQGGRRHIINFCMLEFEFRFRQAVVFFRKLLCSFVKLLCSFVFFRQAFFRHKGLAVQTTRLPSQHHEHWYERVCVGARVAVCGCVAVWLLRCLHRLSSVPLWARFRSNHADVSAPLPGSTAHESDAEVDGETQRELLEAQAAVVTALCLAVFSRRAEHDTIWCDAHSLAVSASPSGGSHQPLFQRQAGYERMHGAASFRTQTRTFPQQDHQDARLPDAQRSKEPR